MYTRLFLLLLLFAFPFSALAQEDIDLKAEFLAAWEDHQKSLPTTVTLEKTDEPNVYEYETTLFPYKGKLRLNNILISKDIDYYHDYELESDDLVKGVAEVELSDITREDLYSKFPESSQQWRQDHYLFYDEEKQEWLTAAQLKESQHSEIPVQSGSCSFSKDNVFLKILKEIWPLLLVLTFFVFLIIRAGRIQKKHTEKFDLSMQRQLESLEMQKQSLDLLKELVKLLEQKR